jgi:hypothetical protein
MYAPNINLVHDPRWGRANEVFSECPILSSSLVVSYINGLQNSTNPSALNTPLLAAACCKHFAIYNGAIWGGCVCVLQCEAQARLVWIRPPARFFLAPAVGFSSRLVWRFPPSPHHQWRPSRRTGTPSTLTLAPETCGKRTSPCSSRVRRRRRRRVSCAATTA